MGPREGPRGPGARFLTEASLGRLGLVLGGGIVGRTSPPGRANFEGAGSLDMLACL